MTLEALINPFHITWREFRTESQMVNLLQATIAQQRQILTKNEKIISLRQQQPPTIIAPLSSMLRQREISGRSKCLKQIQTKEADIDRCVAEIKECRSYIRPSEQKLKRCDTLHFYSVVKLTALMAATIFGLGAAFGLLITGISLTSVALVGLAAAISLISREIFLFARNTKRIDQTDWKEKFIPGLGGIHSRELRIQFFSNSITQDMISKRWIRPIAIDIFSSLINDRMTS